MAEDLIDRLRSQLSDVERIRLAPFDIARDLSRAVATVRSTDDVANRHVQELVLRAREFRDAFGPVAPVVDDLLRVRGLYPYLEPERLGFSDLFAYEMNRPLHFEEVVFHRAQTEVYASLLAGENVILSAPTSFGKSLIIDALVASGRYKNIVVVVPTIALIDETRRRLVARFRDRFRVLTHSTQERGERNIFVLTQERVAEFPKLEKVNLFVIDEFYKLDPTQDEDRANLLNQAFYKLYKTGAQFYLLGPNIREIPVEIPKRFNCRFIATDFATVVSEIERVKSTSKDRLEKLVELCSGLNGQTLVYCASPNSARKVAAALASAANYPDIPDLSGAAAWAAAHYHPDWVLVQALRKGIGLHHGKVPRALQQYFVRAFNSDAIKTLVCTSTLIEGVNTKAKNVVVYDNKVSKTKFDFFTFNNIKGRSGRMFEHFVGRVFLFNDPPEEMLPIVDIPALTQSVKAHDSLLMQFEDADLTVPARTRIEAYKSQRDLPVEIIRQNGGIEPEAQIELARELAGDPQTYATKLAWRGIPTRSQLYDVCELIWQFFIGDKRRRAGVSSGKQLAFKLGNFRRTRSVKALIDEEITGQSERNPDEAVENVLEFVRYWPTFNFPRYLMAVDRIQREVLGSRKYPTGDYSFFAGQTENYFTSPGIAALDEYGIPLQLAGRLSPVMGNPQTIDEALVGLRGLRASTLAVDDFERELIEDAQRFAY